MEKVTTDLCEVDFPPTSFGRTLAEVEATVQQVIERVFRDGDGILRSGVWGKTMKPMRPEDVHDLPDGSSEFLTRSAMPQRMKSTWHNYENAEQASGKYLMGLSEKHRATGDPRVRDLAWRTVDAIVTIWNNAARHPYGRGWLPKPYGGIHDLDDIYECSADQYADVTFGLYDYYLHLADADEKKLIQEVILSFADWWHDRDYAGAYLGMGIWWKRLKYPHPTGYFLFLNALAYAWNPCRKFQQGYETWLEIKDGLTPRKDSQGPNECGIAIDALERLLVLRPMERAFWLQAADACAQQIVHCVEIDNLIPYINTRTQPKGYAAHNLAAAHRMLPDRGYAATALRCLRGCMERKDFYYIQRGQPTEGMMLMTDESRNTYWCENLVGWLDGYWSLRNAGVAVE